ncbi:hypothetical protein PSECIP111951_02787 [Pseudoalteromonas holothuriae]|uniref:Uncharacterized protein n=1 Tax=Pseudoalteromonas holothuriae TaxID=2963714 RepID=A0A9W4QVP8_9GAMM|nr:hypothetical protein PSECIP111854_01565 [Pseudoalteromonas sp. CIP111854]CAH9062859.1 hypothetical protein PSECIP111951_02787 [Pseudoalteromonas sp. CIP111951]
MFKKHQIGLIFALWCLFLSRVLLKCARPHPVGHPVDDVSLVRGYNVLIASPQIAITARIFSGPCFSLIPMFV